MPRNIELKARLSDLPAARRIAQAIATENPGVEDQIDTYFQTPNGRLKLREIGGSEARLVAYLRPDDAGPKGSDYVLVPIPDPAGLKRGLSATLGVRAVVNKRREIFLVDNVRVHLDEVAGLGAFLEFEAVLGPAAGGRIVDDDAGHAQLAELRARFGLRDDDLLTGSYGEMIAAASSSTD
jgi:predicted adenylyl cyclase CyaB